MTQWTGEQLFDGLTGEDDNGRIISVEKGDKTSYDVAIAALDGDSLDDSGVTRFTGFLHPNGTKVTLFGAFATQIPAARYGWLLDYMNSIPNDFGRGFIIKVRVERPEPDDAELSLYCTWEMSVEQNGLRNIENLPLMRDVISSALLEMHSDCQSLLPRVHQDNYEQAAA